MEIEVVQNLESILPVFEITESKAVPISNIAAKISRKIPSGETDRSSNAKETGSGFGNSETNYLVAQAAISFITKSYQENGWTVESIESEKCGFDLLCSKNNACEHVEVKGIQGEKLAFPITFGEVEQSRSDENFVLYAVTSVLSNPMPHRFTGNEFQKKFKLKVISYFASLLLSNF